MRTHFAVRHPGSAAKAVTSGTIDKVIHLCHKYSHASVNIAHQLTFAWSLRGPVLLRVHLILLRRPKMFSPPKKSKPPAVHTRYLGMAGLAVARTRHPFLLSTRIA
jgi:hypothetical protein